MANKKVTTAKKKAINDSVASAPTGGNDSTSTVATQSLFGSLSIKQAYETNSIVRRCINATADAESKGTLRLFSRKSNNEITGGDCFNFWRRPARNTSTATFISHTAKWWRLTNEIAILPMVEGTRLKSVKLLDPTVLTAFPQQVRSAEFVDWWWYNDGLAIDNKSVQLKIANDLLIHVHNWNPFSPLRGSSDLVSLANEVTTNWSIGKYNIQRFQNGVQGDLLFCFPKGTKKAVVDDLIERWSEGHGIARGNGFKVAGVIGDEFKVEQLGVQGKDGEFLELAKYTDDRIAGALGTPASVIGFYDKTRADIIDAELENWAENVILPDLKVYSEVYQQINDRYFQSASGTDKADIGRMSKRMKASYEQAMDEHQDGSDIVVIIDPDSMPIISKLNKSKVEQAAKLCDSLHLSRSEAAEYVGLEIPHNPIRDDIYILNTLVNASKPQLLPTAKPSEPVENTTDAPSAAKEEDEKKVDTSGLKAFYRNFRQVAIKAHTEAGSVDKTALVTEAKQFGEKFVVQFHKDFIAIREIQKRGGEVREVKDYFNGVSKPAVLKQFMENK